MFQNLKHTYPFLFSKQKHPYVKLVITKIQVNKHRGVKLLHMKNK